jgi:putative flippase GtrA
MPKLNASTLNALLTPQFIVYLAGGVLSAAIDIGVMQWLLHLDATLVTATSVGFFAGMVVNFAFHARVTFKNVATPATFARYMCVVALNYLVTLGIVALGVAWLHSALAGKIISLPVVAMNGFFLSKHWIYR